MQIVQKLRFFITKATAVILMLLFTGFTFAVLAISILFGVIISPILIMLAVGKALQTIATAITIKQTIWQAERYINTLN